MIPRLRLRQHTDGRVAVSCDPDAWRIVDANATWTIWGCDSDVTGDGWDELFVAELASPTDEIVTTVGVHRARFGPVEAHALPGSPWDSGMSNDVCSWNAAAARSTASALVAAAAWVERVVATGAVRIP